VVEEVMEEAKSLRAPLLQHRPAIRVEPDPGEEADVSFY
jgi:hypothetical protein